MLAFKSPKTSNRRRYISGNGDMNCPASRCSTTGLNGRLSANTEAGPGRHSLNGFCLMPYFCPYETPIHETGISGDFLATERPPELSPPRTDGELSSPESGLDETCLLRFDASFGDSPTSPVSFSSPCTSSPPTESRGILNGIACLKIVSCEGGLESDSGIAELDDSVGKTYDRLHKTCSPEVQVLWSDFSSSSEENVCTRDTPNSRWPSECFESNQAEVVEIYDPRDIGFWWWSDQEDSGSGGASAVSLEPTGSGVRNYAPPNANRYKSRRRKNKKALLTKIMNEEADDSSEEMSRKPRQWKKRLRDYHRRYRNWIKRNPGNVGVGLDRWCSREEKRRLLRERNKDKRLLEQRFCKKDALLAGTHLQRHQKFYY